MKNIRLLLFSALAGLSLMAVSCDSDNLYDTDHPDKGDLRVITSWGSGVTATIPYIINYSLEDGDESGHVEAKSIVHDLDLVKPGKYNLNIYSKDFNTGFTLDGDVIQVDQDPVSEDPDFIYSNPSVFFSARTSAIVNADKANKITVPMYPQMRKLVIRIYLVNDPLIYTWENPGGDFREIDANSIVATLTGVANRFDFISDVYSGSKKLHLPFKEFKTADNKQRFLQSTVTLVGFNEADAQNFSLAFDFKNGLQIPSTSENFHDLLFGRSEEIGDFNDYNKKRTNDTIKRQIVLPMTASGSAIIEPYEPIQGGDIVVGEDTYKYKVGDAYPKNTPIKDGIVIWVAEEPGTPGIGSHGVVMSGKQSDLKAWGPTAEICRQDGGQPWVDQTTFLRQYTAIHSSGTRNASAIKTYINENKGGDLGTGYLEQEFEAYAWISGSEKEFLGSYWFLPSVRELLLLNEVADLDDKLAAANFPKIENATLWSSQVEPELKPEDEWLIGIPEYKPSQVFIRTPDGNIGKTLINKENPLYDPNAPAPDPTNPDAPQPEPKYIPIKYNTRAFRFF